MSTTKYRKAKKNNLSIYYVNVCGPKSKLLNPDFVNEITQYDILCFTETKVDDYDEVVIPGYDIFSKNRNSVSSLRSGGIMIATKQRLSKCVQVMSNTSDCVLWIKLSSSLVNGKEIVIGTVYIPPEGSPYYNHDKFDELDNEISKHKALYEVILIGDYNAKTRNLPDFVEMDAEWIEDDIVDNKEL